MSTRHEESIKYYKQIEKTNELYQMNNIASVVLCIPLGTNDTILFKIKIRNDKASSRADESW